ncbi:hypothetical protein UlMin_006909 [Ulmus minor]
MFLIACFVLVVLLCYIELFGSVHRSLLDVEEFPTWFSLVDKIKNPSLPPLHQPPPSVPPIRWRKGDLIGCGTFGSVYLSMNLDSREFIVVRTVATTASKKKKAHAHIKELKEEVKLLKNLNHPNIVGDLGIVRDEETTNILLEYVPSGSISLLLGKFGAFMEALLLGLEYLHRNGIMHRDIKVSANILVDAKGCIKLADFGASKQVVELTMRGTPYWMALKVILQTGYSFVGCTVIEIAIGKCPWSQQYQEVAALFYIGTTKFHPPIPYREPNLQPTHPFVTRDTAESYLVIHGHVMFSIENSETPSPSYGKSLENFKITNCSSLGSLLFSTISAHYWRANCINDIMCQIDDDDDFTLSSIKYSSTFIPKVLSFAIKFVISRTCSCMAQEPSYFMLVKLLIIKFNPLNKGTDEACECREKGTYTASCIKYSYINTLSLNTLIHIQIIHINNKYMSKFSFG